MSIGGLRGGAAAVTYGKCEAAAARSAQTRSSSGGVGAMLLFCPGCGNGLIVEEGQRCHRFACNTCPYVHNVTRKVGSPAGFAHSPAVSSRFCRLGLPGCGLDSPGHLPATSSVRDANSHIQNGLSHCSGARAVPHAVLGCPHLVSPRERPEAFPAALRR